MLREIRLVQAGDQALEILIADELFCLSVILELSDLFHGVFLCNSFNIQPVEEDAQISDVIVDRRDADGLSVIPPSVGIICQFALVIAVYNILLFNKNFEALYKGIITTSYSLPCDL